MNSKLKLPHALSQIVLDLREAKEELAANLRPDRIAELEFAVGRAQYLFDDSRSCTSRANKKAMDEALAALLARQPSKAELSARVAELTRAIDAQSAKETIEAIKYAESFAALSAHRAYFHFPTAIHI